jgi:hypothetical protein
VGERHGIVGQNQNGAAYVFTRAGRGWRQQQELQAADGATLIEFGDAVALSVDGTTALVVGTPDNVRAGGVYVFTRTGTTWHLQQKLPFESQVDAVAVSADGSTALIGSGTWPPLYSAQGVVYVYVRHNATWSQQQELSATDSDSSVLDNFGDAVALSADGTTALIGAPGKTIGTQVGLGAAYVFERRGMTWNQRARLTSADGVGGDHLGNAVAVSADGQVALVGPTPRPAAHGASKASPTPSPRPPATGRHSGVCSTRRAVLSTVSAPPSPSAPMGAARWSAPPARVPPLASPWGRV